jgi:1-acyl-sn-glycerol-3-phosphate acyltransferase
LIYRTLTGTANRVEAIPLVGTASAAVDLGAWLTLRVYAHIVVRRHLALSADGLEHLPENGPIILASRHVHHLYDACALLSIVPRPLHIMVALDWARSPLQRRLLEGATLLARWPAVIRSGSFGLNDKHQFHHGDRLPRLRRATYLALDVLRQHRALLIFPEGYPKVDPWPTPSREDAELLPFNRGCVDLAWIATRRLGESVPVVPIGLHYQSRRSQLSVRVGSPLRVDRREERETVLRELGHRVAQLSQP